MEIMQKMRLDGKKAFVTGGAKGIGKSVATAFAQAGADVAIVDMNLEEAQKTAREIAQATGQNVLAIKTNVTRQPEVDAMIQTMLDTFGRIDVAVCNAGIGVNVPAAEMTLEQWQKVIDVNLTGVFLTAQAAGKVMLQQGGGSIINTASMSGHIVNVPQPQCAYNASKAGVIQLTKSMAVEWADKNVRVNSVSPGYIGTELTLNDPNLKPMMQQWNGFTPMHRMGTPEELQSVYLYLACDASSFTTGADISVDGAYTCF